MFMELFLVAIKVEPTQVNIKLMNGKSNMTYPFSGILFDNKTK